jgi:hypothetical protein
MALCMIQKRNRLKSFALFTMAAAIALFASPNSAAQSLNTSGASSSPAISAMLTSDGSSLSASSWSTSNETSIDNAAPAPPIPPSPAPPPLAAREKFNVAPDATYYQQPFSRIGIGADVSPLGVGIKSAIILDHVFDARLMGNYFNFNSRQFEIEGFRANADFHLSSLATAVDWYPFASVWRISPGVLFLNGNQLSGKTDIIPGTSFSLDNQTFFSANANAATGATPLQGSGSLAFHSHSTAFTIAGGFGKFIPRSNRHWSFPTEFGVAFTGSPKASASFTGWVCTDYAQTNCSDVGNSSTPAGMQFNGALQTALTKWNRDLALVKVYPLLSYSVVYSFNIRH